MNGLSSNVLSRPEAILQAQQFSKRLLQDSVKLITDTDALKKQGIAPQRIAMYLATEHPSIKLVGVLLQLPPDKRVPVLTGDGDLSLEQARMALQPIERLQHDLELRQALAQALPSWFPLVTQSQPTKLPGIEVVLLTPSSLTSEEAGIYRQLDSLVRHLEAQGLIRACHRVPLSGGPNSAINAGQMVILVATPALINNAFLKHWLPRLTERMLTEGLRIVPILISHVEWENTAPASLVPLPTDGVAVLEHAQRDATWRQVASGLRRSLEQLMALQYSTIAMPKDQPSNQPRCHVTALYAEADRHLFDQLKPHTSVLQRSGRMDLWHAGLLVAGERTDEELRRHVREAHVILLLLSADFLTSDRLSELAALALERHNAGHARVLHVLLRPIAMSTTPYAEYQCVPRKPVVAFPLPDEAWSEVVQALQNLLP